MATTTTTWFCDQCGDVIEAAAHGWVEWLDRPATPGHPRCGREVRIVHDRGHSPSDQGCQYRAGADYNPREAGVGDRLLAEFAGPDGPALLLEFLADGRLEREEALGLARRVLIPGYEATHRSFVAAVEAGVLGEDQDLRFPRQVDINAVLDWLNEPEEAAEGSA